MMTLQQRDALPDDVLVKHVVALSLAIEVPSLQLDRLATEAAATTTDVTARFTPPTTLLQ